jgi:hypothetical protein
MMNVLICVVLAVFRVLIFIFQMWLWNQGMSNAFSTQKSEHAEILRQEASKPNSLEIHEEERVRGLIGAWCSAYSQLDSKEMTLLEAEGAEIVDGFGDLHSSSSRGDRERFWAEGFEILEPREFHPQCALRHIQLLGRNAAVVQLKVLYPHGIKLKGGELIRRYSEAHTFVVAKNQEKWLIAAHIFYEAEAGNNPDERPTGQN